MNSLNILLQPAIDERWYPRLQAISTEAEEIYYPLAPSEALIEQARRRFVASGRRTNPDLRTQIEHANLYVQRQEQLGSLKAEVITTEQNADVRRAYENRIDELLLQIDILMAATNKDGDAFSAANRAVYGTPSRDVFSASCAWLRLVATAQASHPHRDIRDAAKQVLSVIPDLGGDHSMLMPTEELFAHVKALHNFPGGYFSQLFAGVSLSSMFNESIGDSAVEQALRNIHCSYGVMETSNANWGVSHTARAVIHPRKYTLSRDEFAGVLAHEVGSHLLERTNGMRQPLRLLASGLDRYEASNEGRAYLREQIIYNEPTHLLQQDSWRHILTMHLAISLASGLAGSRHDFKTIYEILYPVDLLWKLLAGLPRPAAEEAAYDETWKTLTRVLKGTDGTGGAYLKDMVYLEGNVRCWQLAKTRPEMILYGDLGKFDITRADHVALLRGLGILP